MVVVVWLDIELVVWLLACIGCVSMIIQHVHRFAPVSLVHAWQQLFTLGLLCFALGRYLLARSMRLERHASPHCHQITDNSRLLCMHALSINAVGYC